MTDRFPPGTRVRTFHHDPPHHTRLPRYARGKRGVVVEPEGPDELPDISARGSGDAPVEQIYAVRFEARDLWGEGDHHVVLDLWESYLEADLEADQEEDLGESQEEDLEDDEEGTADER